MYAITWLLIGIYSTSTVVGEIARLPFVIMPLNCIFSFHGYIFYTNAVTVIGATRTILIFQTITIITYLLYLLLGLRNLSLRGNWQNYLFIIFPTYSLSSYLKKGHH